MTASDTPEIIIRLAGPEDALVLSRLRYEFRADQYAVTEDEADFLARCGAWMAARLAHGSHWRCWVAEDAGRLVGAIGYRSSRRYRILAQKLKTTDTSAISMSSHRGEAPDSDQCS